MVRLSVERIFRRDQRVLRAGLSVSRELDPALRQALVSLYSMQAGLPPENPRLQQVRGVWDAIIAHYRGLEYDDVAEAALKTKPAQAVDAADQYAEIATIRFQEEKARRDLVRRLKQYEGAEKIGLTPELKEVLAAWTKWIGDHSASPLAPQAVEQVLGIGRLFEQHEAFEVAAGVYGDFAKFAAGVKPLAQSIGNQPSVAETAGALAAGALDKRAEKALAKQLADRKPDEPPPSKISDEFAAAIAAHKAFLAAHPNSLLSSDILRKITGVAVRYAQIDAWEVAEGVYADLAASDLKIRRPERLDFARGICELGRAMPAHAREILAALNAAGLGEEEKSESSATALASTVPADGGDSANSQFSSRGRGSRSGGGGGFGGMAGGGGGGGFDSMAGEGFGGKVGGAYEYNDKSQAAPPTGGMASPDAAGKPAEARPQTEQARHDEQLLAMVQREEMARSMRIAQMNEQPQNAFMQRLAQAPESSPGRPHRIASRSYRGWRSASTRPTRSSRSCGRSISTRRQPNRPAARFSS